MRTTPRGSYVPTWSSVGGTVWQLLGGVASLEEVCNWEASFEVF